MGPTNNFKPFDFAESLKEIDTFFQRVTEIDILVLLRQRNGPSKDPVPIYTQRKRMCERIVKMVRQIFQATRCGILVPTDKDPNLWNYIAGSGFSSEMLSAVVSMGEGLTGTVFEQAPNSVDSENVISDDRWSKRFGDEFNWSEDEKKLTPVGIAFLGIPLSPRIGITRSRPRKRAAMVLLRAYSDRNSERSAFLEGEKLLARVVGNYIAYALDMFESRLNEAYTLKAFEEVSKLDLENSDLRSFGNALLEKLSTHIPNSNMLLSVVDPHRTIVRGICVSGRFSESIALETVRPICSHENENEDSLSRMVRLKERAPREIDPSRWPLSPWSKSLQQKTQARHRIQSKHLLLPLLDDSLNTVGVVIVVSDKRDNWTNDIDRVSLKYWVTQLGISLSRVRQTIESKRRSDIHLMLLNTLASTDITAETISVVANRLLAEICSAFDFECGIVYRFDNKNGVLRGVGGHNVNQPAVRQTVYSTTTDTMSEAQMVSLALEVFRTKRCVHVDSMKDRIVDSGDMERVHIPPELTGAGIPLLKGGIVQGVWVLCFRNICQPEAPVPRLSAELQDWLLQIGGIMGALFSVSANIESNDQYTRVSLAQTTIMQQIEHLLQKDGNVPHENDAILFAKSVDSQLNTIVEDAANVFNAEVAGIFLSDSPAMIPLGQPYSNDSRKLLANKKFVLAAGVGYLKDALLAYTPSARGLTSHVLWSLESQRTDDVEGDRLWSRRAEEFIDQIQIEKKLHRHGINLIAPASDNSRPVGLGLNQNPKRKNHLRTWMGVPICLDDSTHRHVFGVLTFTRYRKFDRDRLSFTEHDVATARSIATMLAVVLFKRREVGRWKRIVDSLLRTFRHDDVGHYIGNARECFFLLGNAPELSSDNGSQYGLVGRGIGWLTLVQSIFDAYSSYLHTKAVWDMSRAYNAKSLLEPVFEAIKYYAIANKVTVKWTPLESLGTLVVDRSKLQYIILAVARNAIKSCELSNKADKCVQIELIIDENSFGTDLRIEVQDNGRGIDRQAKETIFVEGFSTFKGSGIGLAVVKNLISLISIKSEPNRLGSCKLEDVKKEGLVEGAKFTASIPMKLEVFDWR